MIGYKATINGECKDQLYEVGKTYTLDGELIMCEKGFHFCEDLIDVFKYYNPNKDIKVFKIEALGNIKTFDDKSVTDKIMILEEVDLSNMVLEKDGYKRCFDCKCNYIKEEGPYDYWAKYEYDSNKNRIKEVNANGFLIEWEYDENSNLIRRETSDGHWAKYEYDSNNNIIKEEHSDGFWIKYEYDENNNIIKCEDSYGWLEKYEYDENNYLIEYSKDNKYDRL